MSYIKYCNITFVLLLLYQFVNIFEFFTVIQLFLRLHLEKFICVVTACLFFSSRLIDLLGEPVGRDGNSPQQTVNRHPHLRSLVGAASRSQQQIPRANEKRRSKRSLFERVGQFGVFRNLRSNQKSTNLDYCH